MSNDSNLPDKDYLSDLQERVTKESLRSQFRTQKFGGLNEEDVTNYVLYIEDKLKKLEKDLNKERNENLSNQKKLDNEIEENYILQKKVNDYIVKYRSNGYVPQLDSENPSEIIKLQNEIFQISEENTDLKSKVIKLEQQLKSESSRYDILIIDSESSKQKIVSLEETILSDKETIEKQQNIIDQAKKEFENLLSESTSVVKRIKEKASGFEEETKDLKLKVIELEAMVSSKDSQYDEIKQVRDELKSQIEFEKTRNEELTITLRNYKNKIRDLEELISSNKAIMEAQNSLAYKTFKTPEPDSVFISSNKEQPERNIEIESKNTNETEPKSIKEMEPKNIKEPESKNINGEASPDGTKDSDESPDNRILNRINEIITGKRM